MAKNHVDRPMKMMIYNSRLNSIRETTIVPSHNWGGKTLLGASIRFCQVDDVADRVWHVAGVVYEGPAHKAGLIPQKGNHSFPSHHASYHVAVDWIIGSPDIALNCADDFYNLMIHNQKRQVRLLVFNIEKEQVREVSVIPDFHWGGSGCLGCDVASGALHRIPPPNLDMMPPKPAVISEATTTDGNSFHDAPLVSADQPKEPTTVQPFPQQQAAKTIPQLNLDPIPGFEDSIDNNSNDLGFLQ